MFSGFDSNVERRYIKHGKCVMLYKSRRRRCVKIDKQTRSVMPRLPNDTKRLWNLQLIVTDKNVCRKRHSSTRKQKEIKLANTAATMN